MRAFEGIWELAKKRLRNATRVTIAGYSFPATDVEARQLFANNTAEVAFLNVVDPDPSVCDTAAVVFGRGVSEHYYSFEGYNDRFHRSVYGGAR
jgi:hypothetical protein